MRLFILYFYSMLHSSRLPRITNTLSIPYASSTILCHFHLDWYIATNFSPSPFFLSRKIQNEPSL